MNCLVVKGLLLERTINIVVITGTRPLLGASQFLHEGLLHAVRWHGKCGDFLVAVLMGLDGERQCFVERDVDVRRVPLTQKGMYR